MPKKVITILPGLQAITIDFHKDWQEAIESGKYSIRFSSAFHRKNQTVKLTRDNSNLLFKVMDGKPFQIGDMYYFYRGKEPCPCFVFETKTK